MHGLPTRNLKLSALACVVAYGAACGGDTQSLGKVETVLPLSDEAGDSSLTDTIKELTVASADTVKKTVNQCFCAALYRSTLLFYQFPGQKAVLTIQFDNTDSDFPAVGVVYLFDGYATQSAVSKWINNRHSDGLYIDAAVPMYSIELDTADIAVTSSAFQEAIAGYNGDSYERYIVEFTVSNVVEDGWFFLNSFSDQTEVNLQISPPVVE